MKIESFQDNYRWLSNFVPNSYGFSVEHYFQAAKAKNSAGWKWVMEAGSPGAAKQRGKDINRREDWEEIKLDTMLVLLRMKFCDPVFQLKLIETGDIEIIEGNYWHDIYWGVCKGLGLAAKCNGKHEPFGENNLGKLLMKIRGELSDIRRSSSTVQKVQ